MGAGDGTGTPSRVEQHSDEFFEEVRAIVGERFAEARFDPDRALRVMVVNLDEDDAAAIHTHARRLGIDGWVRAERADPAALEAWELLRQDLLNLQDSGPDVLVSYPTPEPGYRCPPVEIQLTADAEAVAANLHATYGDFVALRVGALPYPARPSHDRPHRHAAAPDLVAVTDPAELRTELDGVLSIRSGDTKTHTGATVGGYAGWQHSPLIIFRAARSQTVRIPLLVGTASLTQDLGYKVPPGTWGLTATIHLADGRQLRTQTFTIEISE